MRERKGRDMELLHGDFSFRFRGSDGAARFGDESKLVVDIVSQSQGCRVDTVKRYIHGNGVFIALHVDVTVNLHTVADGGTAEFAGGQVDKKRIVGVDIQVHVHMGGYLPGALLFSLQAQRGWGRRGRPSRAGFRKKHSLRCRRRFFQRKYVPGAYAACSWHS